MKEIILLTLIAFVTIFAKAQDTTNQKLEISGYLMTNQKLFIQNYHYWAWNENRLNLEFNKNTENLEFHAQIWLRNMGLPEYYKMSYLYNKGIIDPYNQELREAYAKMKGFIIPNIDLTVGRQIISWGTSNYSPTDNVNPDDMEDIFDFGRKRGTEAINLEFHIGDNFKLQGIFEPFYKPANLPLGFYSGIYDEKVEIPTGMRLVETKDSLFLPYNDILDSYVAAFKFSGKVKNIDFSLSYIYGRDYFSQPFYVRYFPIGLTGGVKVTTGHYFPCQHIFGFDFSTKLGEAKIRGEASAILPTGDIILHIDNKYIYPYYASVSSRDSILITSDVPYFKYSLGADYVLPAGFYLNVQYNHGFVHERGNEELNDYYFVRLEKKFFDGKLKIVPVSGAFVVGNYSDIAYSYSWIYLPEIVYSPFKNCDISLSASIIDGEGTSLFAKLKDYDLLTVNMKFVF